MQEQRVGVVAVIKNKDKFLFLKRHTKSRYEPSKWGFVGEAIEFGESPVECLKRGVKEETNLELKSWKFVDVYSFCFEAKDKVRHAILLMYVCEVKNDKVKINEESEDFGWFTLNDAKKLDLIKGNEKIVEDLEKKLKHST